MIVGIPGTMQDAVTWIGWFGKIPRGVFLTLVTAGIVLILVYFFAIRERIRTLTVKLLGATSAGYGAFRKRFRPPIPTAVWSDLDSEEPSSGVIGWQLLGHTLRKTAGMISGEAYPALVGVARVSEIQGQRHLYMCHFVHESSSHMELRIEAHDDPVFCRRAVLRVGSEILADMAFEPCLTPAVFDSRRSGDIREDAAHLLRVGEVLSLSVTDTVRAPSGAQREHRHDILRVPLRGYGNVDARLTSRARNIWANSVLNFSPLEFTPGVDPQRIDIYIKSIIDPASYDEWRKSMAAYFVIETHVDNSTDQTE